MSTRRQVSPTTVERIDGRILKRLTVYLPSDLARSMAVRCAEGGVSVSDFVTDGVKLFMTNDGGFDGSEDAVDHDHELAVSVCRRWSEGSMDGIDEHLLEKCMAATSFQRRGRFVTLSSSESRRKVSVVSLTRLCGNMARHDGVGAGADFIAVGRTEVSRYDFLNLLFALFVVLRRSFDVSASMKRRLIRASKGKEAVTMRTVREGLGMSQAEIARALETEQSEVSRIERRSDLMLSTVRKYAAALGARCEVAFVFGGKRRRTVLVTEGKS